MKTAFRRSFLKDIHGVDKSLRRRVEKIINEVEMASSLQEVHNLKRLTGKGQYYRVRVGDYRLGLKIEEGSVVFMRFLHRKDMYRYFP